uniref:Coatomer subunit epsilon n=1 Tax=Blastobotrys adeninivorans TaxID=409370 RepID=A0A060TEV6_BLAAD
MDPFSDSGELFSIQQAYYIGDYQGVLAIDTTNFSDKAKEPANVLAARAKIRLGRANEVTESDASSPGLAIVQAYAQYSLAKKSGGNTKQAVESASKIIEQAGKSDSNVQYLGGIILASEGKVDEALELLKNHEGSLECVSLIIHLYLAQNRVEDARKEAEGAKRWAQDNIVYNLAEAWTDLRLNGEHSQSAYYIYQELTGGAPTAKSLVGQAVAHLQQGQFPEAEEELKEALQLDPENAEALANSIALAIVSGKDYADLETKLETVQKDHPSLVDLKAKEDLFSKVVEKYAAKATA